MKRVFVLLAVIAGLGFLGWRIAVKVKEARTGSGGGGSRGGSAAVAVELTAVRKATVREIGRFTGSLSPRSRFVVAPKVAGRLERLTVDIGDIVTSGQLIAELDDGEYAQQVEQARAEVAVAKANVAEGKSALDVAARDLDRAKSLREKKVASESELDEAEARHAACSAKYNVVLAGVMQREAALKASEVRFSYTRIHAVWRDTGTTRAVGERFVDEGAMLTANAPIVSILDNSIMTALIDVIARDYPKIQLGQRAVVTTDGFPGREFAGKVVRIAPLLKELSRQARVEIEMPNADGALKPGMFVRAELEFARHENATVVPVAALVRRDGREGVFLADTVGKQADFVPVTLGIIEGDVVEVAEPLLTGSVVTLGHHLLSDGAAIRLPEPGPSDAGEEQDPNSRAGQGWRS